MIVAWGTRQSLIQITLFQLAVLTEWKTKQIQGERGKLDRVIVL